MMRYKKADNAFYIFADDVAPRYLSALLPLDYDTIATGDKFGNLVILRLPQEASQQVGEVAGGGWGWSCVYVSVMGGELFLVSASDGSVVMVPCMLALLIACRLLVLLMRPMVSFTANPTFSFAYHHHHRRQRHHIAPPPPPPIAQVEDDPTGGKMAAASGKLNGAPHKLEEVRGRRSRRGREGGGRGGCKYQPEFNQSKPN